jgi:ABC-type Na+ efflux pump permease subunit
MALVVLFRVFAALLAIFGAMNILLLVLSEQVQRFFPAQFHAVSSLSQAVALFGVGAGVYLLSEMVGRKRGHAAH